MIDRPAFRYHGGKWRLAPWIINHFPEHDSYVEPFSGAGSVLLQKDRSPLEVLNDLDGDVVNFFLVLRDEARAEQLQRALYLTPYALEEWELSFQPVEDPVERARRFYVRCAMNIAGGTARWASGWRRQKTVKHTAAVTFMGVQHLAAISSRLRGVFIERMDALQVVELYDRPGTLFYVDPPYVAETRGTWAGAAYSHEVSDDYHTALAECLNQIAGVAIVSGYDCELYRDLYDERGWHRVQRQMRPNGTSDMMRTETLWLSPALATRSRQPSLFWMTAALGEGE